MDFPTLVDSDSSACSIARNLLTALIVFPAFKSRVGALSRAISRIGPNLCADEVELFIVGGNGEEELGTLAPPVPTTAPPAVEEDVTDQVLCAGLEDLSDTLKKYGGYNGTE